MRMKHLKRKLNSETHNRFKKNWKNTTCKNLRGNAVLINLGWKHVMRSRRDLSSIASTSPMNRRCVRVFNESCNIDCDAFLFDVCVISCMLATFVIIEVHRVVVCTISIMHTTYTKLLRGFSNTRTCTASHHPTSCEDVTHKRTRECQCSVKSSEE